MQTGWKNNILIDVNGKSERIRELGKSESKCESDRERERARASHKNDINGLWIIGIDYDNRVTTNLNGYLNGHRYLKITRKIHSIHSALLNIVEISMGKSFVFAIGPHAILAEFPDFWGYTQIIPLGFGIEAVAVQ